MTPHELSVLIPYYKHDYFQQTLEALAAQTDLNFSVHVFDDASRSAPDQLIADFGRNFQS